MLALVSPLTLKYRKYIRSNGRPLQEKEIMPTIMIEDMEPGTTITVIYDGLHVTPEPDPGLEHVAAETKRKKVKLVGKNGTDND